MKIFKYKTSVISKEDADILIGLLEPLFLEGILNFDLKSPDKVLVIESHYDEDHSELVEKILAGGGFECKLLG